MQSFPLFKDQDDVQPARPQPIQAPPRRWQFRQWRTRLPWLLLILTLIISGLWVQRLRDDVQRNRRAVASLMWIDMHNVAFPLDAMASFSPDTQEWTDTDRLFQVQQEAGDAQMTALMYQHAVGAPASARFNRFTNVFSLFTLMADTINHSDEIVDERAAMAALTADMRLLRTLFPEELLVHGTPAELEQAMVTWCDQMQLKTIPSALTNGDSHLTPCP
jgi:hypothetical protein